MSRFTGQGHYAEAVPGELQEAESYSPLNGTDNILVF